MTDAEQRFQKAREMLVLRDEFAGDALPMDDAVEEMRTAFEVKNSQFYQRVSEALKQERFTELNKLLLGYRGLPGEAEQAEYANALELLIERGNEACTVATQIMSCIDTDASGRAELPASMDQLAGALRWIEATECLSTGDDPCLPENISAKWQQLFVQLTAKLKLLEVWAWVWLWRAAAPDVPDVKTHVDRAGFPCH